MARSVPKQAAEACSDSMMDYFTWVAEFVYTRTFVYFVSYHGWMCLCFVASQSNSDNGAVLDDDDDDVFDDVKFAHILVCCETNGSRLLSLPSCCKYCC